MSDGSSLTEVPDEDDGDLAVFDKSAEDMGTAISIQDI